MKRILLSAVMLGVAGLFLGCGDEAGTKTKETVTAPGGTTTTVKEEKVKSTGENPPANTAGETAKSATPPK
jgi:hypothetical protein